MTLNEMEEHLKDCSGLCNSCREKKKHADSLKDRILGEQKEEI
jgi:hypothetical protein